MFDGVPVEQFHQFISTPSSRIIIPSNITTSSSLIQTPPMNSTSTNLNYLSFDPLLFPTPLSSHHHHQTLFQSNDFVRIPPTRDQYNCSHESKVDHQEIDINDSWSNDEVIQLLRIKSSSESWFRDFTWDHVSRKLAEMGYKRSAERCKEKFEEETCRSFSSTIGYNNKNHNTSRYLISEELDENLYSNADHHVTIHEPHDGNLNLHEKGREQNLDTQGQKGHFEKDPSEMSMVQLPTEDDVVQMTNSKKRKRKHKRFKMVKGLCVDMVQKMMAQQEEMHTKLLEEMVNREEEKIKKEEAWRKEETERVQREIHIREHEHEMARDRQSTITEFLNKISSFDQKIQIPFDMSLQDLELEHPAPLREMTKIPSSVKITENPANQDHPKDDTGRRWPRDEVLALINTRSNVSNGTGGNNEEDQDYIGNNKGVGGGGGGSGSLWERISQGMLELGYKRSAKRCKEKWENINKYFRKTKDTKKKRSLDSRTCPYYHELSKLYNQQKTTSSSNSAEQSTHEPEIPAEQSTHEPEICMTANITPEN